MRSSHVRTQPIEFLGDEVLHTVGCVEFGEAIAVLADDVVIPFPQLLADGVELLAEHELALLFVHALTDVVADRLGDLQLVEMVARPRVNGIDAIGHVDGPQHTQSVVVVELGPQRNRVGELAGRVDRTQQLGQSSGRR